MFPNIKKNTLYKLINDFIKNKRDIRYLVLDA